MNKVGFLFLGAVISAGSVLFVGCGGGETSGNGGNGGGSDASSSSTSGTPASSSSTGASSSSTGGGTAATPESFCKENLATCTADNGQYTDEATCITVAKSFTAGTPGEKTGNTLECRVYHTTAAKTAAAMHCGHSGLLGGDLDPTTAGGDLCGDGVEAFCKLAVATCKGVTGGYPDEATCAAEAKTFPKSTAQFSITKDTTGNTFNCRAYHLMAATKDAASATMHCPHIKLDSTQCK